ncbi:MAG: polyisoprenoid-binding protein [Thiotrichaceae bacterium]|nr:polyisoprenoid-binding protein [Thiotrichaceae bacterium]
MKKLSLVAALMIAIPTAASAKEEHFTIDPLHTYPHFKINHLGFSTMQGHFGKTSGKIMMDRQAGTGSIDIVIDAASVYTGMKKRDDHLRSIDFLNVMEFPEITYKAKTIEFHKGGKMATAHGDLTILGVTKHVALDVASIHCGIHPMDPKKEKYVCGFDVTAKFKRSDFDMSFSLPAIGDEMALFFGVEAIRNKD